ncbi:MAG: glycosyltransferase [Methanothrix sp.]|nr:glycosyltransferase [Methanothrix sp.]
MIDALDSVLSQTFQDWECILINDTGHGLSLGKLGAPWARLFDTPGKAGPAYARNLGVKNARGEALLFLDADDLLMPWAIEDMYDVYLQTGSVVYTDWVRNAKDPRTKYEIVECPDFVCGEVLGQMRHAVTCLVPRSAHLSAGGFDVQLKGWEDWDYFIALQSKGICSTHLPEPCFIYRMNSGTERVKSLSQKPELLETLRQKWSRFYSKEETMACSGCGQRRSLPRKSREMTFGSPERSASNVEISGAVLLEYVGPGDGKMTFRGRTTGTTYRVQKGETKYFDPRDAQSFLSLSDRSGPYFKLIPDDRSPSGERLLPVDVDAVTKTTVLEGA